MEHGGLNGNLSFQQPLSLKPLALSQGAHTNSQKSETYLGTYQTSAMELFMKMVNVYSPLTVFVKKFHRKCLVGS